MPIQHIPFSPARKDLAEAVFMERWQSLNKEAPIFLASLLSRPRIDQRGARVAASFIRWIGTNCGAAFILQAQDRIKEYGFAEPAYLAAWALANRRQHFVNANVRTIEVIMSAEELFRHPSGESPVEVASKLGITLADQDVIEAVVVWLSTPHGNAFVQASQAEYEAKRLLALSTKRMEECTA